MNQKLEVSSCYEELISKNNNILLKLLASMVWIIGEYAERIDNADELLESFLEGKKLIFFQQ